MYWEPSQITQHFRIVWAWWSKIYALRSRHFGHLGLRWSAHLRRGWLGAMVLGLGCGRIRSAGSLLPSTSKRVEWGAVVLNLHEHMYKYIYILHMYFYIYIYKRNYPILVSSFVLVKGPHAGYSNPRYHKISILYYWHSASLGQDFEANPVIPFWLSGGRRCATAQLTPRRAPWMSGLGDLSACGGARRTLWWDGRFHEATRGWARWNWGKTSIQVEKMIEKHRSRMLYKIIFHHDVQVFQHVPTVLSIWGLL